MVVKMTHRTQIKMNKHGHEETSLESQNGFSATTFSMLLWLAGYLLLRGELLGVPWILFLCSCTESYLICEKLTTFCFTPTRVSFV